MTSSPPSLVCAMCKYMNPPGSRYCLRCGEAVASDLLIELQRDYSFLRALDATIGAGDADMSAKDLREKVLARYLAMRTAHPPVAPASETLVAPDARETVPAPAGQPPNQSPPIDAAVGSTPMTPPAAPAAHSAPAVGPTPPTARGQVFSWRAFIADQAIAILAYLGGFLLLIATLTFEVGGWTALNESFKLAGVTLVYVVFGALGIGLRRVHALRTVGRVYLGVFALMTPLEALAVYLFALQRQGFPVAGMVCLSSAYAAVVYLGLAARTRFVTYAYLGLAAALVSVAAIPIWAQASWQWQVTSLALGALGALAPRALEARRGGGAVTALALPGLWISGVVASFVAVLTLGSVATEIGGLLSSDGIAGSPDVSAHVALAVTSVVLAALAISWSQVLRTTEQPAPVKARLGVAWLVAAFAAMSACAIAIALGATASGEVYTLAGAALVEGAVTLLFESRPGTLRGVSVWVKALTMALAAIGVLMGASLPPPHYPMLSACVAGVALGAMYAGRGRVPQAALWGVAGGVFALIGASPAFRALVPETALDALADTPETVALELSSLYAGLSVLFVLIGAALRSISPRMPGARNLRISAFVSALLGSLVTSALLPAHTGWYAAAVLGSFSAAALLAARIERWPVGAGVVCGLYGAAAALMYIATASNGLVIMTVAPLVALLALGWYFAAGRAYALPVYSTALVAVFVAVIKLILPVSGIPEGLAQFALGPGGQVALIVAALMAVAALREQNERWQIAPAGVSLLCVFTANALWPLVALTLLLAATGALSHALRGQRWGIPWHSAALLASAGALSYAYADAHSGPVSEVIVALIFLATAWLVAWQERMPWLSTAAVAYALVALAEVPALPLDAIQIVVAYVGFTSICAGFGALARARLGRPWALAAYASAALGAGFTVAYALPQSGLSSYLLAAALIYGVVAWALAWQEQIAWYSAAAVPFVVVACMAIGALPLPTIYATLSFYIALTLLIAGLGALARARLGRPWALALYLMAIIASLFPLPLGLSNPDWTGLLEGALLVYAAVALGIALIEDNQVAVIAPALYAAGAALVQPDGRALLPLALGLAAAAYVVSRARGGLWALPLYGSAVVAAIASSWQGQAIPTFEPLALGALALAAWLIAALESRAEGLLLAYVFAGLALPAVGRAFDWESWAVELAFVALSWIVAFSGLAWARLPWLRPRDGVWLSSLTKSPRAQAALLDPRQAGMWISRGAALALGGGVTVAGALAAGSFATRTTPTFIEVVALASLTGLLLYEGGRAGWRPALYAAIETAALALTWQLRWFGADNPQAWIVGPGSAQILIGALLPADTRLNSPRWLAQAFSVAGALILMLPTLAQSITEPEVWQWVYALVLALEALTLTLLAVGLRNRTLALSASAFVGVAAIRGAVIAVEQNLPIPIVIGVFALALMGLATWLSLRARRNAASEADVTVGVSEPPPAAGG